MVEAVRARKTGIHYHIAAEISRGILVVHDQDSHHGGTFDCTGSFRATCQV